MAFKTYLKENIPEGYKNLRHETDDIARTIVYSHEGDIALILDKNNGDEYFEGILSLSDEKDLYKLCDPNTPKNDKDCLKLRFDNLLEILVRD